MTLGDDVVRVLPDFRLAAQSMMIDEGSLSRDGAGAGTIDPVTGVYTPAASTVVYSGVCRVKKPNQVEQQIVFGDEDVTVSRYIVNVPFDAPLAAVGDVFTLTETDDPEIQNVPMRVKAIVAKSVLMHRQYGVEVIE